MFGGLPASGLAQDEGGANGTDLLPGPCRMIVARPDRQATNHPVQLDAPFVSEDMVPLEGGHVRQQRKRAHGLVADVEPGVDDDLVEDLAWDAPLALGQAAPRVTPVAHGMGRFAQQDIAIRFEHPEHFPDHRADVRNVVQRMKAHDEVDAVVRERNGAARDRFHVAQWLSAQFGRNVGVRWFEDGNAFSLGQYGDELGAIRAADTQDRQVVAIRQAAESMLHRQRSELVGGGLGHRLGGAVEVEIAFAFVLEPGGDLVCREIVSIQGFTAQCQFRAPVGLRGRGKEFRCHELRLM